MAADDEEDIAKAASKVQEAAANIQQATTARSRSAASEAETVARQYFAAISAHDLDAAVALWAVGGREHVRGQVDALAPEGVRTFIGDMLAAMPDMRFELLSTTTEGERCAVQWRLTGTFTGPSSFNGVAPTGHPLTLEGIDLLSVRDGLVQGNDAYSDAMTFARQIGMLPPQGSAAEQRMTQAFNVKTRVTGRSIADAKLVAEGVWVVQGQPGRCNVYLIEDEGGVTLFDAGARTMLRAVASAAAKLGGIRRVVLGHGHTDHRGVAPALGVPVLCHPDAIEDAEGSRDLNYWPEGLTDLPTPQRQIHRVLQRFVWDGGPVKIAGTARRGRRDRGLPRRGDPRTRPRPDRAVARVRPPGAGQRRLLHARHVGARPRARRCPTTTSTPSRPARACASSPPWSPPRRGRATRSPSRATCACSWSARPTRPDGRMAALAIRVGLAAPYAA